MIWDNTSHTFKYLLEVPLEECLALKQRADQSTILLKGQRSESDHAFFPEGIQIEDLTQASCHA